MRTIGLKRQRYYKEFGVGIFENDEEADWIQLEIAIKS
jgi:hypothetical protein